MRKARDGRHLDAYADRRRLEILIASLCARSCGKGAPLPANRRVSCHDGVAVRINDIGEHNSKFALLAQFVVPELEEDAKMPLGSALAVTAAARNEARDILRDAG
jgi:hypothetical protein